MNRATVYYVTVYRLKGLGGYFGQVIQGSGTQNTKPKLTSPNRKRKLEVSTEHIPHANVYGIECYNYSSSADSATPRD